MTDQDKRVEELERRLAVHGSAYDKPGQLEMIAHDAIALARSLEAAAKRVLSHRVGVQPVRGWLRDNDESRSALTELAAAIQEKSK